MLVIPTGVVTEFTEPFTLPVTVVTLAGVEAFKLVFIVAVKSPAVGALVKFVTVVMVPAVIFVGDAITEGTVTPAAADIVWPAN